MSDSWMTGFELDQFRARVAAMRAEAERVGASYRHAGHRANATGRDLARARLAESILRNAAEAAHSIPTGELHQRAQELRDWPKQRTAAAIAEAEIMAGGDPPVSFAAAVEVTLHAADKEVEAKRLEFDLWLEGHALAAWTEAVSRLAALADPEP